jgi:hypothetical protein
MTDEEIATLEQLHADKPRILTIDGISYKIASVCFDCSLIDPYLLALSVYPPDRIIHPFIHAIHAVGMSRTVAGQPKDNPTVILVIEVLKRLGLATDIADAFLNAEYGSIIREGGAGLNFTRLCSWSSSDNTTAQKLHNELISIFGNMEYSFADILALHFRGEAEDTGARTYGSLSE